MSANEMIYGFHAVAAILQAQPSLVNELLVASRQDGRVDDVIALAREIGVTVRQVSKDQMKQYVGNSASHQGVAAVCRSFSALGEKVLQRIVANKAEDICLLVLDGVQDPHNLGACLRSANAFAVDAVIAPKDRACGLTPVVRKVACGGAEMTPFIQVTNLARTLKWLQEQAVWLVGLTENTDLPLREIDLSSGIALVLGNEGQGLRKLTVKCCDYLAMIPTLGAVQSLNVSASTAIGLYEVVRQRTIET